MADQLTHPYFAAHRVRLNACAQEIHKFMRDDTTTLHCARSPGWQQDTPVGVYYRAGRYTLGGTSTSVTNYTEWIISQVNPRAAKDTRYHTQRRKLFDDEKNITLDDMQFVFLRIDCDCKRNGMPCRRVMLYEVFVRASMVSKLYENN
jgi:hypothetical protein